MTKRMLIDATHEEETRVAVMENERLLEFDYESKYRKPLKGSIFLAKVTRVEPSLQAAFVNFGGNRHGFLPFSEIHPDYFRIPIADREALIAEQEKELDEHDEADDEGDVAADNAEEDLEDEVVEELGGEDAVAHDDEDLGDDSVGNKAEEVEELGDEDADAVGPENTRGNAEEDENENQSRGGRRSRYNRGRGGRGGNRGGRDGRDGRGRGRAAHNAKRVETFGDSELDEETKFRFNLRRKYKIQEVIKRGQIMLVQVSKEERGNKGAAVSSYLSLPGRYCVLMPNSPRGGGVSRKIANYKDRAKIRDMIKEMDIPKGMSVIVRTAGMSRTKTEIKRDLDYLMRLWNDIRELTLESSAPALVYEEANLIKRAVRDLYSRDIDEVHVAGKEGHDTAKKFMKMMIPSHAKKVQEYAENDVPLFNRYKAEAQIAEIGETQVTLPSGGYLVINPTEALVSIDVNSGRATKERHIEETALKTNLEAATEVARQLKLRDLGGLVVVDFIDMEDRRNNGKVERRMRDALSTDRARIQMGRISSFGLMEMSRQRMNPSLTESQFETCGHCSGMGRVRTADATSVMVLRAIEEEGMKDRAAQVIVHVPNQVALYLLNYKRKLLANIEVRYGFTVLIRVDEELGASGFRVEVARPSAPEGEAEESEGEQREEKSERSDRSERSSRSQNDDDDDNNNRRRRGRRGGRGRNNRGRDDSRGNREEGNRRDETASQDDSEKTAKDGSKDSKEDSPKEDKSKDKAAADTEKPKSKSKAVSKTVKKDEDSKTKEAESPKKSAAKKSSAKSDSKPEAKKAEISNDDAPKGKAADKASDKAKDDRPKDFEKVNQPPETKKKGWWSR